MAANRPLANLGRIRHSGNGNANSRPVAPADSFDGMLKMAASCLKLGLWRILAACVFSCAVLSSRLLFGQDAVLQWKPMQAQLIPNSREAIAGGGSAMPAFVCRAKLDGGVLPGQWIKGGCEIAHDGQVSLAPDYEIASGDAMWADYNPQAQGILQTGNSSDGSPLYSCRVEYRGSQVGVVTDNKCAFVFEGRYIAQRPPFEALYFPGGPPQSQQGTAPAPAQQGSTAIQGRQPLSSLAPGANTSNPNVSCRREVGKVQANRLVQQCLQVSPATHPPCNADNNCRLIRDEIKRSCDLLGNQAPDFCASYR